ncbi:adenylate/guanylate cyclase domain-containing protein [Taklimakanibacter lacteus]|uniref:adenylate/guanylate cyclase domain-containing protein n=1 Tax=Taklimakanibacter lacteus TaxID=2268456 RepID=UPI000E6648E5
MTVNQDTTTKRSSLPRWAIAIGVLLLLAGLPLSAWLDLRNLAEQSLRLQASDLNSVITSVRSYYSKNVVGRVLANPGTATQVIHNYAEVPGAIPIPATLSLELGKVIGEQQGNITYRFVSDYPFKGRAPHELDPFEQAALQMLRGDPKQVVNNVSWNNLSGQVRLVAPVLMAAPCVACHNKHPDSPKKDWKEGDVRGIQEVIIDQPIARNLFSFRWLLSYFGVMAAFGLGVVGWQNRQSNLIAGMNKELESNNAFLAAVSMKISRYLSPQLYKSIFAGEKDVAIQTERKKLTIFFSDIKDFTATTEKLQPEEITALLNEYFTEMSAIATKHGGTVDKFIGDAILIFFGDPETKGVTEDALACLRMAFEMQARTVELNAKWRSMGVEERFLVRMGINTGFCNVGNFGSSDRMDYTIIGAEANLAARLQSVAEPGQIVLSYETYALVREMFTAHSLPPIQMKGISRPVVPYVVDGMLASGGQVSSLISEHMPGLDLYLDPSQLDEAAAARTRSLLQKALASLDTSPRPRHSDVT